MFQTSCSLAPTASLFFSNDEHLRSVIRVGFGMPAPQLIRKYLSVSFLNGTVLFL